MTFDVADLRLHFPSLTSGIAHFDGPGGTQTPREVGAAIAETLTGPLSNRGAEGASERAADAAVAGFRSACADLLNSSAQGIVYGRSATQLTYDFSRALAKKWGAGDEVVVSALDHDANIRPWIQAAAAVGATVRWIEFDPSTTEIPLHAVERVLTDRTRLVAVTGASNLLGSKPPIRQIADRVHAVGALLYVDGVHYTAHNIVDVIALGADFFICSAYKFLGPHCGILTAAPELLDTINPDKLLPSTDEVPERFEFGTLPYEIMAGVTAAIEFLAGIAPGTADHRRARLVNSMHELEHHERILREHLQAGLAKFGDAIENHSKAADRTPTVLLTIPGRKSWDAYQFLAARDVLAPAGSFYACEPFRRLGLQDIHGLRIGMAPYNNLADVDRLLNGLEAFLSSSSSRMNNPYSDSAMRREI